MSLPSANAVRLAYGFAPVVMLEKGLSEHALKHTYTPVERLAVLQTIGTRNLSARLGVALHYVVLGRCVGVARSHFVVGKMI